MSIVSYILDELISAMQRNSVDGPPPEHWYPPAKVRAQLALAKHRCMYCGVVDPKHRRVTKPPCTGRV